MSDQIESSLDPERTAATMARTTLTVAVLANALAILNITVISYMDSVDWGFIADKEAVPDLWDLANAVPEALAELTKAAAGR